MDRYLAWADAPQTIEGIGSWTTGAVTLTGVGDATRVAVANVSPSLLPLLRAQPLRGRLFNAEEGHDNKWRIAILSQGFWEQRFGAREDIVGQTIVLEGGPATVVGILPRSFRFPSGETQMWLPMSVATVDAPGGVKRGQILRRARAPETRCERAAGLSGSDDASDRGSGCGPDGDVAVRREGADPNHARRCE